MHGRAANDCSAVYSVLLIKIWYTRRAPPSAVHILFTYYKVCINVLTRRLFFFFFRTNHFTAHELKAYAHAHGHT